MASDFTLTDAQAEGVINRVRAAVDDHYVEACDQALLTRAQRERMWGRELCNEYVYRAEP